MKPLVFLCSFLLLGLGAFAQFGADPVEWAFTADLVEGNTFLLSFQADAEEGINDTLHDGWIFVHFKTFFKCFKENFFSVVDKILKTKIWTGS
ncbi:MAG: hypothetical protein AAF598_15515 [Bacteroidota bacterium]